jgi:hypothetical protein
MFCLRSGSILQSCPDPAGERIPFGLVDGTGRQSLVEPVTPAGGQVCDDTRSAGVHSLNVRAIPQRGDLSREPITY